MSSAPPSRSESSRPSLPWDGAALCAALPSACAPCIGPSCACCGWCCSRWFTCYEASPPDGHRGVHSRTDERAGAQRRAHAGQPLDWRNIVNEAAAMKHVIDPAETPLTPESWGKLGMWVFLVGDAMSFGGLLAAYAALRISSDNWPVPSTKLG